jgi:hypothetical protein
VPAGSCRSVALGALGAALAGMVMIAVALDGGREQVFRSDADLFRRVALDPFGDGSAIDDPQAYGDAYRYGRILYPLAAWVLGGGQGAAVEVALAVVAVLSFGAVVGLGAEHLRRRGRTPAGAVLVLLAPGLWLGAVATFSEPFVLALLLLALLLELDGRRARAGVAWAATLLAREAVAVALVPVVLRDARARGVAPALLRVGMIVAPLLAWWAWVRVRVGDWPFLDDAHSRRDALALPFTGFVGIDNSGFSNASSRLAVAVVVTIGLATLVLAALLARRSTWPLLPATALALASVIAVFGPNVWRFVGEAMRTMSYPHVLMLLVVADLRSRRPA